MSQYERSEKSGNDVVEMLKDLMIIQLALAGIPQSAIRKIVGCSINRVNRIAKHLKSKGEIQK